MCINNCGGFILFRRRYSPHALCRTDSQRILGLPLLLVCPLGVGSIHFVEKALVQVSIVGFRGVIESAANYMNSTL
jgi:hypothetical protein